MRRALSAVAVGGQRFWSQNMPHHAAALTYFSVLALFQAMLIALALLGLLGTGRTVQDIAAFAERLGVDQRLVEALAASGRQALERRTASAVTLGLAVLVALVSITAAFLAATTALNVVVEARDDRPFGRRWLAALRRAVVAVLLAVGAVIAVFLGGGLAREVFATIGLGATAERVWTVGRLPLATLLAMTAFAWVYYSAPSVPEPRWRWISLGAATGVIVWLAASLALFAFAGSSGSFDTTYGSFGTAVLLLVWLWLTNAALLLGAEVNAAGRYAEGVPAPLSRTGDSPEEAQHEAARSRTRT